MKRLLHFLTALLCLAMLSATTVRSQTAQAVSNEFQEQVQRELTQFPSGLKLYKHCDIFARKINAEAVRTLRQRAKATLGALSIEHDTSLEGDVSRTTSDEDEPSIAINRRDPRIILAGANELSIDGSDIGGMVALSMPAYLSTDAGASWNTYRLPPIDDDSAAAWGDPMIISDNDGTFYYAFLLDGSSGFGGISDLMVARSPDGKNWTLGSPVVGNNGDNPVLEDKETIAIDRDLRSPYYGRLYIAWTEYQYGYSDSTTHFFAYSDNKGDTWSSPVQYTQTYGYFALLRVGARGTIFISSMAYDTVGNGAHGMTISIDGGASFTDLPIAPFTDFPLNQDDRASLKGENGFRAVPYPCFDVDSGNRIFAVYGSYDQNNGDAALYEVQSSDLGRSWTHPRQLGSARGMGNDHYMPWVSVDPITQHTYISMSSSEEDTVLNVKSRAVRCDYQSPSQLQNLGTRLFNTLGVTYSGGDFLGDYAGSDAYNGCYAASWTENRPANNHDGDIFAYVSGPFSAVSSGSVRQINGSQFEAGEMAPNPASGNVASVTLSSNEERNASVRVFNLTGSEVLSSQMTIMPSDYNRISLDIHALPAGVYRVLISSGADQVGRNLVILR